MPPNRRAVIRALVMVPGMVMIRAPGTINLPRRLRARETIPVVRPRMIPTGMKYSE